MGQGAQLPVRPQLPDLPATLSLLADLGLSEVALERILVAYTPTFFLWPQVRGSARARQHLKRSASGAACL